MKKKKIKRNTDVELKVFIFPSPSGTFIDRALPNTESGGVGGGGGWTAPRWLAPAVRNRNIFTIKTSRRSGVGGANERCPVE